MVPGIRAKARRKVPNQRDRTSQSGSEGVGYWLGNTKILKHAQFLCQFYELRKLDKHTGVEGCGFVAWFGQYTEIALLVSLFFLVVLPIPAYCMAIFIYVHNARIAMPILNRLQIWGVQQLSTRWGTCTFKATVCLRTIPRHSRCFSR